MSREWFEIATVCDNQPTVHAIQEPGHAEEVISYLIVGNQSAILIDTGMGIADIKTVVDRYTRLPVQVINTHSHWDHIGGNHLFGEVAIHEAGVASLEKGVGNDTLRAWMTDEHVWRPLPRNFKLEEYRILPCKATRLLKSGDLIDLGDYRLEILHLPGHSPDSICLWNKDAGHLFTGDVIYEGPLFAHLPGSNLKDYFRSIKRIAELLDSVEIVFPAHNRTPLDSSFLEEVIDGFEKIEAGKASFKRQEGHVSYTFPRFQVFLPEEL